MDEHDQSNEKQDEQHARHDGNKDEVLPGFCFRTFPLDIEHAAVTYLFYKSLNPDYTILLTGVGNSPQMTGTPRNRGTVVLPFQDHPNDADNRYLPGESVFLGIWQVKEIVSLNGDPEG